MQLEIDALEEEAATWAARRLRRSHRASRVRTIAQWRRSYYIRP